MVHDKQAKPAKNRALMIRSYSHRQLTLVDFERSFLTALNEKNRWVKTSQCIPGDTLAEGYYQGLSLKQGYPSIDASLVIDAAVIKHKLCLSDRTTVAQIPVSSYLHCFVGLPGYRMDEPFAPALIVEVRKRMEQTLYEVFQGVTIDALEKTKITSPSHTRTDASEQRPEDRDEYPPMSSGTTRVEAPKNRAQSKLDATVEGWFGQGKGGYGLNDIRAKRAENSFAWINSIFQVINLQVLLRGLFAFMNKGRCHGSFAATTCWDSTVLSLTGAISHRWYIVPGDCVLIC
jgi:hypothetical protein